MTDERRICFLKSRTVFLSSRTAKHVAKLFIADRKCLYLAFPLEIVRRLIPTSEAD